MKNPLVMFIMITLCGPVVYAHPEKWYVDNWCNKHQGNVEVVLEDRTRCDCVTSTHAIEFDFGEKWAEAIGQALHYSRMLDKRAGIVLILEQGNERYRDRVEAVIKEFSLPIDIWIIEKQKKAGQ